MIMYVGVVTSLFLFTCSLASDAYTHHVAIVGACTSHIFNSIPLARLLIENGHKVTFVTPNKCRSRILSVGAELYKDKTWPEFKASDYANPFLEVIFAKESMWHSSSVASKELDEWLQDKTKLDVIIGHGLNPLVSTIADKHQIPFLLYYANGIPLVTDENLHKPLLKIDQIFAKNSFLYNQAAEILVVGFHQIFAFMTSIEKINHMRDSLSLQYVSTISQLWQSYPIVCPFNEPFVYHGSLENLYKISLLPQMHSLMSIPDDILQWLMSSEQPVIYMALGTSVGFTLSNQTLDMIFTIFQKQTYYRILWSLKQAEQYEQKIVDPNHLMIKKFLPQIALLERPEIAGFLTHCGAASIMEAVKFEVPLILYPQGRDQMFTAMNAFDAGVGIYLNSPETLSKVLAEFMDKHDVLKKNVVEARKQVASIKGWDRLSKLITDLARSKKSSFIQRDDVLLFYIYKWLTILAMLVLGILSLFGYIFYRCCCKSKPKKLKQQ